MGMVDRVELEVTNKCSYFGGENVFKENRSGKVVTSDLLPSGGYPFLPESG